jgi:hypothetical protein
MTKTRLWTAVFAACGVVSLAGVAGAQGYGEPPPGRGYAQGAAPGTWGFVQRRGVTLGVGASLGGMTSASEDLTECFDCDYQPVAGAFDIHLGGMVNPRMAIMGELFIPAQLIDDEFADFLVQPMLFAALQYWLTPHFWLKGGLCFASLQVNFGDTGDSDEIDTGGAWQAQAGFEVLQAPNFTIDINGRLTGASYNGIDDNVVTGTVGIGANWY